MDLIKDEKIKKVIDKVKSAIKLTRLQNKVYVTGGCVRNSILGLPIKDVDFAVEMEGGGIILANLLAAKEKCFMMNTNPVIFPSYGTAKVCLFKDEELKNINLEFVETRKSSLGTNKQCFGTLEEDSKRRDLSINALYWNITDGKLYDFNEGISDMTTRTLKTPNPEEMFVESPIKMLRVIRFSSELGWDIEKNTWLSIMRHSNLIKKVPQETITNEITKILVSPNASIGVRKLMYCGLLQRVMPDIQDLTTVYESRNPTVTAFDHTMKVLDTVQPVIESRLAALYHDIGSIVTEHYNKSVTREVFSSEVAASDLKTMLYSSSITKAVEKAIKYHNSFKNYADGVLPPDKKIRKFINLCGEHIGTTIDLMNANNLHCTYGKKKRQALDILNRMEELDDMETAKNVKLPINGVEIIKHLGLSKGSPIVGIILEKVKDAFLENPKITKKECLDIVEEEAHKILY